MAAQAGCSESDYRRRLGEVYRFSESAYRRRLASSPVQRCAVKQIHFVNSHIPAMMCSYLPSPIHTHTQTHTNHGFTHIQREGGRGKGGAYFFCLHGLLDNPVSYVWIQRKWRLMRK